jgi:glycosyltransferase involved in cell wall biosynthesis
MTARAPEAPAPPPAGAGRRDVCAIIPCYNEAAQLVVLTPAVRAFLPLCAVIDDGSTDDTAKVAAAAGAHVVRFEQNRGKGAALKAGFAFAAERGCAAALTLDGDGQHDPAEIPKFLELFDRGDCDAVLGDRMGDADAMPWVRRTTNRVSSRMISRAAGTPLPDTQSGYRLIRTALWGALRLECERFDLETEFLLKACRHGARIRSTPIRAVYRPGAPSRIRPLLDAWRFFRALRRFRK